MSTPLDQPAAAIGGSRAESSGALPRPIADLYMFIRFPAVGFSLLLPLLGVATLEVRPPSYVVGGMLLATLAFHVYAYVLNDVIDLPVDRTEPYRADYPLVRGVVGPRQALIFALAQLPVAVAITLAAGGRALAVAALLAAFAAMTAYDLWGKRCALPMLTDAVQGIGWAALTLYGTLLAGTPPTALTGAMMAYVFVYILMINGVHGALRDLENDRRCGARTTALLLGARAEGDAAILIPTGLRAYALLLQAALGAIVLLSLGLNWFGYAPAALRAAWALAVGLLLVAVFLLHQATRYSHDKRELIFAGMLHLVVTLGTPLALLLPGMSTAMLALTLVLYAFPVLAMWAFGGLKWG